MLRTYRTCNSTVRFSKYEFYNKLLGGVTLLRVTPSVTWTQPFIHTHTHYKNLNLSNWSMTYLLIFDHLKILQAWRIYENNVI